MNRIVSKLFAIFIFSMMPILGASDINDTLTVKRTYGKDLWGYSQKEKDVAAHILSNTLYPQQKELEERIKDLKESDDKVQELKEAKIELEKINRDIDDQEVVTGIKYSKLKKGALYTLSATALLGFGVAVDYFLNNQGMMRRLVYGYDDIKHDIWFEGGWFNYLRNRTIGKPYDIQPASNLQFWNRDAREWQLVEGNEELAKRSVMKLATYPTSWEYDSSLNTMIPTRSGSYVWDQKINSFRAAYGKEDDYDNIMMQARKWAEEDRKKLEKTSE